MAPATRLRFGEFCLLHQRSFDWFKVSKIARSLYFTTVQFFGNRSVRVGMLDRKTGPLLVQVRKGNILTDDRLKDHSINAIVKRRLGKKYSAHSLRVAFVTISKMNGSDDSEVIQQTKHKTADLIRRYT